MPSNSTGTPLAGGIVSGGLSSRMGQAKDRIILPDGHFMIAHPIARLLEITAEVVIAGPQLPAPLSRSEQLSYVSDNFSGSGPLSGIEAILSSGVANGYLICACDQPLLTTALLRELLKAPKTMPCFFETSVIQPFPGYYPASWLPDIQEALRQKRLSLKYLIAEADVKLVKLPADKERIIASFNCPEELSLLNM